MRRFALGLMLALGCLSSAQAQDAMPDRRFVVTRDIDYAGNDMQALFDTTLDACENVCLNAAECVAFTFNNRSNACFPKSEVIDRTSYEGAISARVVETPQEALPLAATRRADLDFLRSEDLDRARDEAMDIALRHAGGQWTETALLDAATKARDAGNLRDALHWTGAALAQSDSAALWLQYGQWGAEYAATEQGADERKHQTRAFLAAINGYLRSESGDMRINALHDLALALELGARGRDMIL